MLNNINNFSLNGISNEANGSGKALNKKNNSNNNTTNSSNVSSGSSTLAFLNAMIGEGGIEKLEKITNEIEEESKRIDEELKSSTKKKYTDLSPLEQLMYNLDRSLENYRRMREHQNLKYIRELQFREYTRSVYGVSD